MRRMICHAMDYIRQFCNLYQVFTDDRVVSFMWSLSPGSRVDAVYWELLKNLDTNLYSLPWARTGVAPDGTREENPELRKAYHEWGKWTHNEMLPLIKPNVLSRGLRDLGLFYGPALTREWRRFIDAPEDDAGSRNTVLKLCSIELSRRRFNLQPCRVATAYRDLISDGLGRAFKNAVRVLR